MRRWLSVYALAFFAFLHLPLLTLAAFSFNSSRFTVWQIADAAGAWNSVTILWGFLRRQSEPLV
jgi:ABC-type spermidine/putrescine transport system permease subunit II